MLNNVVLMGRLAADAELKTSKSNKSVTSFPVAVDRNYGNKDDKQTDFIDIVAWGSTAEFVTRYFKKGSMIAIQGSIQTRMYEDRNGHKRKAVEVLASQVSFCGSKSDSGNSSNNSCEDNEPDVPDDDGYPFGLGV